jgi:hypothetical protein
LTRSSTLKTSAGCFASSDRHGGYRNGDPGNFTCQGKNYRPNRFDFSHRRYMDPNPNGVGMVAVARDERMPEPFASVVIVARSGGRQRKGQGWIPQRIIDPR